MEVYFKNKRDTAGRLSEGDSVSDVLSRMNSVINGAKAIRTVNALLYILYLILL